MPPSRPPPPGYYVPAVLFFDVNEEFDVPAIQAHVLRLARVSKYPIFHAAAIKNLLGRCNRHIGPGIQWGSTALVSILIFTRR